MSYSRWLNSNWYIFPSTGKCIEAWRAGDKMLQWFPTESYEEFLKKASDTLTHDENFERDFAYLKEALDKNARDIHKWMSSWRK